MASLKQAIVDTIALYKTVTIAIDTKLPIFIKKLEVRAVALVTLYEQEVIRYRSKYFDQKKIFMMLVYKYTPKLIKKILESIIFKQICDKIRTVTQNFLEKLTTAICDYAIRKSDEWEERRKKTYLRRFYEFTKRLSYFIFIMLLRALFIYVFRVFFTCLIILNYVPDFLVTLFLMFLSLDCYLM